MDACTLPAGVCRAWMMRAPGGRLTMGGAAGSLPLAPPQGKKGNSAQYLTRTQAVRKLQLRLSEFR